MGGFGSGRPSRSGRGKVESSRSIDVSRLCKAGFLLPGRMRDWQWKQYGEKIASIRILPEPDRLHLFYRVRIASGEWESIEETVRIVRVTCPFGGARPYFICPGVVKGIACGRRVAKLYGLARYFLCRHCYCLSYSCQRESAYERAARRAGKIRSRLRWEPGILNGEGRKPKWMRWRTFQRLRAEHEAFSTASVDGMAQRLGISKEGLD